MTEARSLEQSQVATLSNCGESLRALATKRVLRSARGRGNDLGYGNNARDATMGDPQPSPAAACLLGRPSGVQFND